MYISLLFKIGGQGKTLETLHSTVLYNVNSIN